ncbi:efflux RND transporter periplasmic adaptor subunit [Acidipila rosea]|uniref:HlyD family secretion protein n=1 Tax=Acidipila rosea TaxID=768535 RepID=A0A4R1L621_9BACT|nr:efflux RND transporter periplasmic adaptor subunit [Acidipila rosea]TCK72500.1 HlyD family secretion protein [Acidipila rosea]
MRRRSQITLLIVALAIAAGLVLVFRTAPIPIQTIKVQRGPLREVVEEEGKTRMHDHYMVAATVGGKLRRVDLHAGDRVRAGETLAWIDPSPLEPRQSAVLEARLRAAEANQQHAAALAGRAKAEYGQAEKDLQRGRELYSQGIISREALDKAVTLEEAAQQQLKAAHSGAESAAYQVEEAKSALLVYQPGGSDLPVAVVAPADGRVLRILEQSERVVAPGTPLLELGYTPRLEIVSDFLTRDAVRIKPDMRAVITDWGGENAIAARVRTVEPGGFTKVSALGVEEQRVNVICDFAGDTHGLQDNYHVEVSVIVWQGDNVLQVPSSAVFRSAEEWAVFVVKDSRARKTYVRIGHRGETDWEVRDGLDVGQEVIVHPSAEVQDGVKVQEVNRH